MANQPEAQRACFMVLVDLDRIPGAMHTAEDAQQRIEATMLERFGSYYPVVLPIEFVDPSKD